MAAESQREIERMLDKYRMRRRAMAGAPLELHKNTRRLFQDEVRRSAARPFGSAEEAAQNFARTVAWQSAPANWWNTFIPRFALLASVCGAVALVVFVFNRESKRRANLTGDDFLSGVTEVARTTRPMPTPAPAPASPDAGAGEAGKLPPLKPALVGDVSVADDLATTSAPALSLIPMEPQDPPLTVEVKPLSPASSAKAVAAPAVATPSVAPAPKPTLAAPATPAPGGPVVAPSPKPTDVRAATALAVTTPAIRERSNESPSKPAPRKLAPRPSPTAKAVVAPAVVKPPAGDAGAKKIVIERKVAVISPDKKEEAPAEGFKKVAAVPAGSRPMRLVAEPAIETPPAFQTQSSLTSTTRILPSRSALEAEEKKFVSPSRDGRMVLKMTPLGAPPASATTVVPTAVARGETAPAPALPSPPPVRVSTPAVGLDPSAGSTPVATRVTAVRRKAGSPTPAPVAESPADSPGRPEVAKDASPGGTVSLSASQTFVNLKDTGSFRRNFSPTETVKVLSSFQIHIAGETVEIRDGDGSIYRGKVLGTASADGVAQRERVLAQLKNNQLPAAGFRFTATGMNRTLRQPVDVTGVYAPASGSVGSAGASNRGRQIIFQSQSPQVRIHGQATINRQNRISIDAVSQGR